MIKNPTITGEFFLRDGDTYVIYGDSITENGVYARTLENFVLTRFPNWRVTFCNLGWGGDRACNLFRVERDVLPVKPTVFTDNMGMNDANYLPPRLDTLNIYCDAYRRMIPLLRKANPNIRIALISAIAYENIRGVAEFADGCYAQTLRCFSQAKRQLASELGTEFIDLFSGYAQKMGMGKIVYPDYVLSGDGIHPNATGQTIMAQIILKGMNAPATLASLTINVSGKQATVADSFRCQTKNINLMADGKITFSRLTEALPCPVEDLSSLSRRNLDLSDFADEINNDTLTISGLTDKAYDVAIDGCSLGVYTPAELSAGINLSKPMVGPLWDQAMQVAQATQERQNAHFTKWRLVWLKPTDSESGQYDTSDTKRIAELDAQAQDAVRKQHQINQSRWTEFTLTPVPEKVIVLAEPVTNTNCGLNTKNPPLMPLDWTREPVKMIDLRSVVNRAFADEVADDGQGGWSDQGPDKDLSPLPVGRQVFNGVPFDIIDPATNGNKSMLVLSRRPGPKVPAQARVPIGGKAKVVTFLHTGAWMDSLSRLDIVICYAGGVKRKLTFTPGIHICDWTVTPFNYTGAVQAWSGRNPMGCIGLTYTPLSNPSPEIPIEAVEITVTDGSPCIYGLIAITVLE